MEILSVHSVSNSASGLKQVAMGVPLGLLTEVCSF
jgi:hypothetical protein